MNWSHLAIACSVACVATIFTDWFFFGILFHDKYSAFPEVWRRPPGTDERWAIAVVMLVSFATPIGCVLSCQLLHLTDVHAVAALVGGAWLALMLPLQVTNYVFMKIHPLIIVAQSLGWLAKLAVAGLAAVWFLP